ncbi:MAG: NUDIX domain-containing protein [Candidatus Buchananbacteria bacterium]|nr:NUDIX domain-containing protein [Candidatus Buchananbacteria bacterium]
MKKIIQKIVLAGIILYKNKILILQRNKNEKIYPNLWELPSGKKEPLENSIQTLKREIKEETNLKIEPIIPISIFDYIIDKGKKIYDTTQINYFVKIKNLNKIKLNKNEHQNYAWIKIQDLNNYKISKEAKQAIIKTFKICKKIK